MMPEMFKTLLTTTALLLALAGPAAAQVKSEHSDNMSLLANWNNGGDYGQGSDLAFWGNRLMAGSYSPGGFRLLDISQPAKPSLIGAFDCAGTQSDVSIWKDLAFVSVDSARGGTDADGNPIDPAACGAQGASQAEFESGANWEGLRIVSLADPAKPVQLAAVKTDCGSHTHTLVPDEAHNRLLAYILSYPLGAPSPTCNAGSHRKISIVEIPLSVPAQAKVIGTADVSPNIGCHDVTVFLPRKLAAAGCITESQIWDISDPAKPKVITHIPNPNNNIHHSASFSWDGNTLVLGDELGGAEAAPGCVGPTSGRLGGIWFYDVSDPTKPVEKGFYRVPQQVASELCTAHLFNTVPLRSDKDILVASWYHAGTTVVDYTDPANPKQIAFYIPTDPTSSPDDDPNTNMWSAYWYNGHVYANNFADRGLDIFTVKHPDLGAEIPLDHLNPQVQEPLPPPATSPGARTAIRMPGPAPKCTKRKRFRLRLKAPKGDRVRKAIIFVGGRRTQVVKGKALRRPVKVRGLRKGRTRIDVTLRTNRGKTINRTRTYRFC
jgi:hypothetical protein